MNALPKQEVGRDPHFFLRLWPSPNNSYPFFLSPSSSDSSRRRSNKRRGAEKEEEEREIDRQTDRITDNRPSFGPLIRLPPMQRGKIAPLYAESLHQPQQQQSSIIDFGPPSPVNPTNSAAQYPTEDDFELVREYEAGHQTTVLPTSYSSRPSGSPINTPPNRSFGSSGQAAVVGRAGSKGVMASDSYDVTTSASSRDSSPRYRVPSHNEQDTATDFSSIDSQPPPPPAPRRFAAGGFDPYGVGPAGHATPSATSSPSLGSNEGGFGEDKIAEKQRIAFLNNGSLDSSLSPYARAGIEPLSDPMPPRQAFKLAPPVDEKRPSTGKYDKFIPVEKPPRSPVSSVNTSL